MKGHVFFFFLYSDNIVSIRRNEKPLSTPYDKHKRDLNRYIQISYFSSTKITLECIIIIVAYFLVVEGCIIFHPPLLKQGSLLYSLPLYIFLNLYRRKKPGQNAMPHTGCISVTYHWVLVTVIDVLNSNKWSIIWLKKQLYAEMVFQPTYF